MSVTKLYRHLKANNDVETLTASKSLVIGDSEKTFLIGTDALTMTLPATSAGVRYKFINSGADANNIITISPNASDMIQGSFNHGGGRVVLSGTDDKDLVNTKASAKTGDSLVIVGDGVAGWYIEECTGVWTEESQVVGDIVQEAIGVETISDNKVLDANDSGKIFLMATDAKSFTLPATAAGLRYTFINSGADGNNTLTVSPAAADAIQGSFNYGAERVILSGTDDKDLVNTKATSKTGDSLVLVGDGAAGWYVEDCEGIWLEESQVANDGVQNPKRVETSSGAKVLDANDSGKVFLLDTDGTYTLPATVAGLDYTFVNIGADTAVGLTISPAAADAIHGVITLAATIVTLSGSDDGDIINTKASASTGDSIRLIGDGVEGWYVVSSTGIWANV